MEEERPCRENAKYYVWLVGKRRTVFFSTPLRVGHIQVLYQDLESLVRNQNLVRRYS